MGFSASYSEVTMFENSLIQVDERKILENSFSQFVFDNADFNTNTLDGRGTFHAMGGIQCVTPSVGIEKFQHITRILGSKSAAKIAERGTISVLNFQKHASAGLETIKVANLDALFEVAKNILPTVPQFIWQYAKWKCVIDTPGWNGFMEQVTSDLPYVTSKIICLPFVNAPPSEYHTIYTSLVEAKNRCQRSKQVSCFVTFDQPLYWKACDIVAAADSTCDLENVIVRLGGFHLLMSFMGAVGFLMSGSGIEELFQLIYAENCVAKILAGHAYSRAVRAHILTHLALSKIILDSIDFTDAELDVLDDLCKVIERSSVLTATNVEEIQEIMRKFNNELKTLKSRSPTARLWVQYYEMITLMKNFIQAERSGDWELHLTTIQKMIPYFHASGHFLYAKSAHLTDKFWSGIMSDMTIEQCLMRAMKTRGGLTQGRGMSDSSIASWTLGMLSLVTVCEEIEAFASIMSETTEQHVDMRPTRVTRDNADVEKLSFWLDAHNPFPEGDNLMSIGTGIIGNELINCHRADEIGSQMMRNIEGKTFSSVSFKRKDKVQPLSIINSSITVESTQISIDPLLLFQRMCITKHSDSDMKNFLAFDLAPFPLPLFTVKGMRKGTKSSLYSAFTPLKDVQFGVNHAEIIDGGFLLHKVVWGTVTTFKQICCKYVKYVQDHFGSNVCVVFDGYTTDLSVAGTKSCERLRRLRKLRCADFVFDENTIPTVAQDKFLSNESNKKNFVIMLKTFLQNSKIEFLQAFEDADVLIVTTAIDKLSTYDSAEIIEEDIDLLVLLTGLAPNSTNIFFRKPCKGKIQEAVYGPQSLKYSNSVRENIFFLHAFSGCDTTSSLFNIGKTKFITAIKNHSQLQSAVELFKLKNVATEMLISTGELFLIAVYGGSKEESSLNSLRYKHFVKAASKNKFNLAVLPPTESSARQHILRTYHQVQTWLGNYKDPEEWGWRQTYAGLQPIQTTDQPAPPQLLRLISCKCKENCSGACGCRKAGIKCSTICYHCSGQMCTNGVTTVEISNDEFEETWDINDDVQENTQAGTEDYALDEENVIGLDTNDDYQPHEKRQRL
ncbi:hypothetical protein ALC62_12417 [Cyphomyrmex costatus]|uniref:Tesmin/TSO1-like CXC domain-containing protein n=1 Tax=Cyphomyrmex costatus TaxID=456900 RepID=A0A151IB87_9HYME|nr:hypothetical protein ALC62_12417 [Cyphomyrmex costatus]